MRFSKMEGGLPQRPSQSDLPPPPQPRTWGSGPINSLMALQDRAVSSLGLSLRFCPCIQLSIAENLSPKAGERARGSPVGV